MLAYYVLWLTPLAASVLLWRRRNVHRDSWLVVAVLALAVFFYLARDPAKLAQTLSRLARVLPSKLAALVADVAEKFATGLGIVRRPSRLAVALLLSLPLWLCISLGVWAVVVAFHVPLPFTASFLLVAMLVIGVAVPTPGAVGGFHEALRAGLTLFFATPNDTAQISSWRPSSPAGRR